MNAILTIIALVISLPLMVAAVYGVIAAKKTPGKVLCVAVALSIFLSYGHALDWDLCNEKPCMVARGE